MTFDEIGTSLPECDYCGIRLHPSLSHPFSTMEKTDKTKLPPNFGKAKVPQQQQGQQQKSQQMHSSTDSMDLAGLVTAGDSLWDQSLPVDLSVGAVFFSPQASQRFSAASLPAGHTISDDRTASSQHSQSLLAALAPKQNAPNLSSSSGSSRVFMLDAIFEQQNPAGTDIENTGKVEKLSDYGHPISALRDPKPQKEYARARPTAYHAGAQRTQIMNPSGLTYAPRFEDLPTVAGSELQSRFHILQRQAMPVTQEMHRGSMAQDAENPPFSNKEPTRLEMPDGHNNVKVEIDQETKETYRIAGEKSIIEEHGISKTCGEQASFAHAEPSRSQNGCDNESQIQKSFLALDLKPGDSLKISKVLRQEDCCATISNFHEISKDGTIQTPFELPNVSFDACLLQRCIQRLENENRRLRLHLKQSAHLQISRIQIKLRWLVLYRMGTDNPEHYFDRPLWAEGEDGQRYLRSTMPLRNLDLYLERNKDISFVVFEHFTQTQSGTQRHMHSDSDEVLAVTPSKVSVFPVSAELKAALECLLSSNDSFGEFRTEIETTGELKAPYLCCFHSRQSFDITTQSLDADTIRHFNLFWRYIDQDWGSEYKAVEDMLSQGVILPRYIAYLFRPSQIVVKRDKRHDRAYKTTHWLTVDSEQGSGKGLKTGQTIGAANSYSTSEHESEDSEKSRKCLSISLHACHWQFTGTFKLQHTKLTTQISNEQEAEILITDLGFYPLQYAPKGLVSKLSSRGRRVWDCRHGSFVSYSGVKERSTSPGSDRYIVDMGTYGELHGEATEAQDDLGIEAFERNDPPSAEFLFLLPPGVKGFRIRDKKWLDLEVDLIEDVRWNEKALERLVLPDRTKKVIKALVTSKITTNRGTDLIEGKGNGLIILLHGGPGTGKTLTAESFAETAKRPLYRVTCVDIGTEPHKVEKYMESVFHLGKRWNCVVLLDEADVFLQERNLQDLHRNALVSVFLRLLEYHDGVLFLTSNRIGRFDEAFKSRIQLSLHYQTLGLPERKKVWRNFIRHLEDMQEPADYADLRDHLDELAKPPLNGRQIRNSVTLARQLSQHEGKLLVYEHLEDVIQTQATFDDFVKTLNDNFTDDERARELFIR